MKIFTLSIALIIGLYLAGNANAQNLKGSEPQLSILLEDGMYQVNWSTVKEVNSSYFLVEKSSDSIHFTAVSMIKAAGNANFARHYSFSEQADTSASVCYRVILISMNGERLSSTWVRANGFEGREHLAAK